jgi:hypothetical protein
MFSQHSLHRTCSGSAGRRADIGGTLRIDGGSAGSSMGIDDGSAAKGSKSASGRSAGGLGDGCGGVEGGEKQPSSCGICLFLASATARLLAWVTSLMVLACFRGSGAGCSNRSSSGGAGGPAVAGPAAATG